MGAHFRYYFSQKFHIVHDLDIHFPYKACFPVATEYHQLYLDSPLLPHLSDD